MHSARIKRQYPPNRQTGKYIIYWMQQAARASHNPALSYAVNLANETSLPLLLVFVFCSEVPDANMRHYQFMIQGLIDTANALEEKSIELYYAFGKPEDIISLLATDALEVVTDHGYLNYQRAWRNNISELLKQSGTGYTEIETEALIPVSYVSDKEEYTAATLRIKYLKKLSEWEESFPIEVYHRKQSLAIETPFPFIKAHGTDFVMLQDYITKYLTIDCTVAPVTKLRGGIVTARNLLNEFLKNKLPLYYEKRNEPSLDIQSGLSPYLHFGQISVMEIIQQLLQDNHISLKQLSQMIGNKAALIAKQASIAAFAEELIIRRELSFNFCTYNIRYDSFACLPNWAKSTLLNHVADFRTEQYSLDRLLQCSTSDVYWNAAQKEMMETGKMHNYMRMYWGKRLIAWIESPEDAFQLMQRLNNRYELDGRDANAFAGVAWCFGKHDRPWGERPVYGSVRFMNAAGLERKFNMDAYLRKVGYHLGS